MDRHDPATRSRIMATVKAKGARSTEQRLQALLKAAGIKGGRWNAVNVPGKPDVSFGRRKVAIFVDGCFWHGCAQHCRMPASNMEYWTQKIERNRRRDAEVNEQLRAKGWQVLRFWEHQLKATPEAVIEKIQAALQRP